MGFPSTVFFTLFVATHASLNADFDSAEWKTRPITKVIGLLQDMQSQLQKEADQDEEMYEKLGCWCETNDKETTKAIADANLRINELTAAIESFTAKTSQLETEIEKLNQDAAKSTDSLSQSTAIREKENAEFQEEQKDMMGSAASLKGAVESLSAAHGDAAALSQQSMMQVREVLKKHMQEHSKMFGGKLQMKHHKAVASFLQQGYTPASGAIFGILKQMKEEFETNIAAGQKDETQAASEYSQMKAAKTKQLNAAQKQAQSKSLELADTMDKNVQSKTDLEDTSNQLAADTKFLEGLKAKCQDADQQYEARQKVRGEEIQAVSETLTILTSDESQAAFSKSSQFIQLSSRTRRIHGTDLDARRAKAVQLIKHAAMKSGDSQLSKMAESAQLDAFAKVKESITGMMAELDKMQKDEVEEYEFCTSEIKANDKDRAQKTENKEDLDTQIDDLSQRVETLTEDMKMLDSQIAATNVEMKKAGENREAENKDFQVTVMDQKATQTILKKALDRLKEFYALNQVKHTQPAQASYSKSAGSTGAVMMIEQIIKESADVEAKALAAENEAQAAYEQFMADSAASKEAAEKNIVNKQMAKAQAEQANINAKADRSETIENILKLGEHSVALHQKCDFLIKNYEVRQSSRAEEIESLKNALAIFNGANFGFFLQK
jgi:chromosome segregation ATPase